MDTHPRYCVSSTQFHIFQRASTFCAECCFREYCHKYLSNDCLNSSTSSFFSLMRTNPSFENIAHSTILAIHLHVYAHYRGCRCGFGMKLKDDHAHIIIEWFCVMKTLTTTVYVRWPVEGKCFLNLRSLTSLKRRINLEALHILTEKSTSDSC